MCLSLSDSSDWAQIATTAIVLFGCGKYFCEGIARTHILETYLLSEKASDKDRGQRSILNIVAHTGLTESQIFEASNKSKKIRRVIKSDEETSIAKYVLFEYVDGQNK